MEKEANDTILAESEKQYRNEECPDFLQKINEAKGNLKETFAVQNYQTMKAEFGESIQHKLNPPEGN